MVDDEEDPLLQKLRQQRYKQQQQADSAGSQLAADATTIKKLHVSSANLNRVSGMI
jgi:hypothetical protein